MFKIDDMIDQVQNAKKSMVDTMITDEKIAGPMNKFIDTQTEYTKATVQNFTEIATSLTPTTETVYEFWNKAFRPDTYFPSKKNA